MSGEPQDWVLATGKQDGVPVTVRYRAAPSTAAERAAMPILIVVTWGYDGGSTGFPDQPTLDAMEGFEDAVFAAVDGERLAGEPIAVLTSDGVREWRFYAADADVFMDGFNAALEDHDGYPIELEMFEDEDWAAHAELLE